MNLNSAITEIKRIMKDNLFTRKIISDSGIIEGTRLAFYKTSNALFTRPTKEKGRKYNIELLVDCSGSMFDHRVICAMKSAYNAVMLLKNVANIRVKLFNMGVETHKADSFRKLYKRFERQNVSRFMDRSCGFLRKNGSHHMVYRDKHPGLGYYTHAKDGNREVCNIVASHKHLMKQEGDKIMIIMLDGLMSTNGYIEDSHKPGEEMYDLDIHFDGEPVRKYNKNTYLDTIRKIEKDIPLFAIGINTKAPKEYYSNFAEVTNPNDIYAQIVKIMKKVIIT